MNKKISTIFSASLVCAVMLMTPACDWASWFQKRVTGTEATDQKGTMFYLLDANPSDIYNDAHIPSAVNVTLESIDDLSKNWNKDANIVVYCSPTCGTKEMVAKKLTDAGFKNVKVYPGGITEWYKLSKENKDAYPVQGAAKHALLEKEIALSTSQGSTGSVINADELKKHLSELKK